MKTRALVLGVVAGSILTTLVAADPLPIAGPSPAPMFRRHVRDVLEGLDKLQSPLPTAINRELKTLLNAKIDDDAELSVPVQKLLDTHCLIGVSINPESRVKAVRGPAEAVLREGSEAFFLIKVDNQAGVTHEVSVVGPQIVRPGDKDENCWLEASIIAPAPLKKDLNGAAVEYVLMRLRSREVGKREATLRFDVGQGNQDLGFRAEVPILFTIKPR